MQESRIQLSPDTWVYVDKVRSKLIVEIDLPKESKDSFKPIPVCPVVSDNNKESL